MDTTTPVSVFMIVLLVSFALYYCFMFLSCCILKFQTYNFNNNYDICKVVSCFVMFIHTCVSLIDLLFKIAQRQGEIAHGQGQIAIEELAT